MAGTGWNNKPFVFWECFIEFVRTRKYLYIKSEPLYSDRDIVRHSWIAIGVQMERSGYGNMTGEEAERTWASLKRKFTDERKLLKTRSGDPGNMGKEPWVLFKLMGFLGQYLCERSRAQKRDTTAIPNFADDFKENRQDEGDENEEDDIQYFFSKPPPNASEFAENEMAEDIINIVDIQSQGLPTFVPGGSFGKKGNGLTIPILQRALAQASPKVGNRIIVKTPLKNNSSVLNVSTSVTGKTANRIEVGKTPVLRYVMSSSQKSGSPSPIQSQKPSSNLKKRKMSENSSSQKSGSPSPNQGQKPSSNLKKRNISENSDSVDDTDEPISSLVASATQALATIQGGQADRAYHVGQLVTTKMRKYPERVQIEIEKKVNDLLYEIELENCQ